MTTQNDLYVMIQRLEDELEALLSEMSIAVPGHTEIEITADALSAAGEYRRFLIRSEQAGRALDSLTEATVRKATMRSLSNAARRREELANAVLEVRTESEIASAAFRSAAGETPRG